MVSTAGRVPWVVMRLEEFCEPFKGVFASVTYCGAGWLIGANLGSTLGVMAEHCGARVGRHRGDWEVWLPGWGRRHSRNRMKRRSPHRPPLYVTSRRSGWRVEFAPVEKGKGKWVGNRCWRGRFIDVMSLDDALRGERGSSLAERCQAYDIEPVEPAPQVEVGASGAAQLAAEVDAIHQLVVRLDCRASLWFNSQKDRDEHRGRIDLAKTVSSGAIASAIPARFGVRAPLEKFDLSEAELAAWAESFHGGWTELDRRALLRRCPTVSLDVSSCYPLVSHLSAGGSCCARSIWSEKT